MEQHWKRLAGGGELAGTRTDKVKAGPLAADPPHPPRQGNPPGGRPPPAAGPRGGPSTTAPP